MRRLLILMTLLSCGLGANYVHGQTVPQQTLRMSRVTDVPGGQVLRQYYGPQTESQLIQTMPTKKGDVRINTNPDFQSIITAGRTTFPQMDGFVFIEGVWETDGRQYVLLSQSDGGKACPAQFRILDMTKTTPVISPLFGTCSDIKQVTVQNGAITVSTPQFGSTRAARTSFKDGRIIQTR